MNTFKKFQIVFLIDTNISTNCKKVEDHCREVLLTILRVLSHVSNSCGKEINKTKQEYSQMKNCELYDDVDLEWGFKFFNTTSPLLRKGSDHTSFKSFKSVHIESFEEKIKDAFFGRNESSTDKTQYKSLPHPSDNLLAALTEVLHDFKWNDNNDIFTSPVNRRKGKRLNHHECSSNSFEKFVFIISKAPCSRLMLRRFSNKKIIDADIFLDSFMSPALINEYVYKFKISVNWIDMTSKSCCCENDINQQVG